MYQNILQSALATSTKRFFTNDSVEEATRDQMFSN